MALAGQGCRLLLWDVDEEGLAGTREAVLRAAPGCAVWARGVDVGDRDAVYRAAEEARGLVAPAHVSVLVNNAGVQNGRRFLEGDDERVLTLFRVNVLAHFWTCKAFLPAMLEAKQGHVVTVASIAGLITAPGMVDYGASKFAAVGFTEGLRKELRLLHGTAVQTSLLCPAAISTELFKGFKQPAAAVLEPAAVAQQVVEAVRYRREMVVLPKVADTRLVNALLPTSVSDALWRLVGHGRMMDTVDNSHAERVHALLAPSRSKL